MPASSEYAELELRIQNLQPELGLSILHLIIFVAGEYIQKPEIVLKPENLIKVLPGLGSEYKIIFDLLITKEYTNNRWLSVLMFTADTGLKGYAKYGNRVPAVFVFNDKLHIVSAISGDPNKFFDVPTTVGKWMKIEICQHMMKNKGGDSLFSGF